MSARPRWRRQRARQAKRRVAHFVAALLKVAHSADATVLSLGKLAAAYRDLGDRLPILQYTRAGQGDRLRPISYRDRHFGISPSMVVVDEFRRWRDHQVVQICKGEVLHAGWDLAADADPAILAACDRASQRIALEQEEKLRQALLGAPPPTWPQE